MDRKSDKRDLLSRGSGWPTGAGLLGLWAVGLGIRLVCFTGLIASDDLGYAAYAEQIAQGTYRLEAHHYAIRYGILLPVAALYRIWGTHEWTTVAFPLVASSAAPVLAGVVARRLYGAAAGWVAALLMATFPVEVRYASILVPEPALQATLLAAALLFVSAWGQPSLALGLVSGLTLGLAYLIKEPAAFVALALLLFALLRRQWRLAGALAAGCAMVVGAELVWYWAKSGDLLFRLHAMEMHEQSPMAMDANRDLAYRLLKSYPKLMLIPNVHYGLHSALALAAACSAVLGRRHALTGFMLLWAACPLLYLNFGSSSLSHYWALPVAPRYISVVYVPLFLLAGGLVEGWIQRGRRFRIATALVLGLVCTVGVGCAITTRQTGYGTAEVQRLKKLAATARRTGKQVCVVSGPRAALWRQTLRLVAPEILGCGGAAPLHIMPDAAGLPAVVPPATKP